MRLDMYKYLRSLINEMMDENPPLSMTAIGVIDDYGNRGIYTESYADNLLLHAADVISSSYEHGDRFFAIGDVAQVIEQAHVYWAERSESHEYFPKLESEEFHVLMPYREYHAMPGSITNLLVNCIRNLIETFNRPFASEEEEVSDEEDSQEFAHGSGEAQIDDMLGD